jgi:hypothetical protein
MMASSRDISGLSPSPRTDDPNRVPLADPAADRAHLDDVRRSLQTAKENLPDLNNGCVTADQIAALSALIDRMHRVATAAAASASVAMSRRERRHAA